MADKPSKGLVLYGDGLARFLDASHSHLHSLASVATCGFLTLPNAPPSESQDERIVREFSYLFDAADAYTKGELRADEAAQGAPTLSERFMGMKAALLTNDSRLKSFEDQFGLNVLQLDGLYQSNQSLSADAVVSDLLKFLGFQEGKMVEASQFDVVFLHVGDKYVHENNAEGNNASNVGFLNSLVGSINHMARANSAIGARLHLSVLMSYGSVSDGDDASFLINSSRKDMNPNLLELFPRQSYTLRGEQLRDDVRNYCPMLIAQWQNAVTRKDAADRFSFQAFKECGANLAIPADRFLHEVAFKLWKAPKYGA